MNVMKNIKKISFREDKVISAREHRTMASGLHLLIRAPSKVIIQFLISTFAFHFILFHTTAKIKTSYMFGYT